MLVFVGLLLVLIGGGLMLAGRFGLPLGRLPGDIAFRGKSTAFYFPITTCIVISVVLTVVFWIVEKMGK